MKIKNPIKLHRKAIISALFLLVAFGLAASLWFSYRLYSEVSDLRTSESSLKKEVSSISGELATLKTEDQYVTNKKLEGEIKNIKDTYSRSLTSYERIIDLKQSTKTDKLDEQFAEALTLLSERNYTSASALLTQIDTELQKERSKLASAISVPANVPANNVPPSSGYRRQRVDTDSGSFTVDIISADLGSTRVIVDTASETDCSDNCPVLSLGDFVSRNGAYAGINGTYFCPATYPTCAGKSNTFDLLVMNKNKKYFNSDNNVYSTNPVVAFLGGSVRFIGRGHDWGRDTGGDGVLMNYPLLVSGGQVVFGGDSDPKHTSKGGRSFVANKGNIVYIGVVFGATVVESAKALQALGMENALNLDNGGSTALWYSGYKAGPGRNIPNAILFVRR